jgi:uncharacterized protein
VNSPAEDAAAASPALVALAEVLGSAWAMARAEPSVGAIALVGACARGSPGLGSDIDLVVLTTDQEDFGRREAWFTHFGPVQMVARRQIGDVRERRLQRSDGVEIEIEFSIVLDGHGTLANLASAVGGIDER